MRLNELKGDSRARRPRKRVGRGIGSGKGSTAGRGTKGQLSRSGVALKGFEGGQMPLHRRLPKRGFKNIFRKRHDILNLGRLQTAIDAGRLDSKKPISITMLREAGLVGRAPDGVRLLAKGEIKSKLSIEANGASKAAVEAIERAGGKVVIVASDKAGKGAAKAEPAATAGPAGDTDAPGSGGTDGTPKDS